MIISFVNQKGGVGKTTTAINIAASLSRKNCNLLLVDLDPQGSAAKWHGVEGNQAFEVLHQPSVLMPADLETLSDAYDHIIIDAPPSISDTTMNHLEKSDVVVIPVSPSSLDIWACTDTLKLVEAVKAQKNSLKIMFLINRKIPGTRTGREIRNSLKEFDTTIMDTELCQRVAYIEAMKYGVSVMQFAPGSKAADEIEQLCDEIINGHEEELEEDIEINPISALYQEETDNILFRSFQRL